MSQNTHDQILSQLLRKCLTSKYEKYFDDLLKRTKDLNPNADLINWIKIKSELKTHSENFSESLITDRELFESMIDLINDYFSKEVKIYVEEPSIWKKFTNFCEKEKIRYEVIGTYEDGEIENPEISLVTTEYELSNFGFDDN